MKINTFFILLVFSLISSELFSSNIQISNVQITGDNPAGGYAMITFDLSWDNSWRTETGPGNMDAAWIFVKYRNNCGAWQHAWLNDSGHSTGNGTPAVVESGLKDNRQPFHISSNPAVGCFVHRSETGSGTFSATGIQLRWNYAANGLAKIDSADLQVMGVEMVLVSEGEFYIGDSLSVNTLGRTTDNGPVRVTESGSALRVSSVNNSDDNHIESNGIWLEGYGGVSITQSNNTDMNPYYPVGFRGFYTMKYEISQVQYRDFLNTLTRIQQQERVASNISGTSVSNRFVLSNSSTVANRNGIRCDAAVSADGGPVEFYCDLDGDGEKNESNDGLWLACNYLSWSDGLAFLDWSGLRPLTELEYEKICRGTGESKPGEYAWGTAGIASSGYTLAYAGAGGEEIGTGYSSAVGNAVYSATAGGIGGPFRTGVTSSNAANTGRVTSGSGYYGVMEMSGNLWEQTVTVGTSTGRSFTGQHGDGGLGVLGQADAVSWPGVDGIQLRGGAWTTDAARLRVSDREYTVSSVTERQPDRGFRGGRDITYPISGLVCSDIVASGTLTVGIPASLAGVEVPYIGGNGSNYSSYSVLSAGVSGLTATLPAGNYATGSSSLSFVITGTPARAGTASFAISIGGQTCTLNIPISLPVCRAKVSPTEYRNFMCHNLGAANTDADPFTPSWEINGGYWQWGRKEQAAAGPSGPGVAEANDGAVSGWSDTNATDGSLSDFSKTVNDPCPVGFKIPDKALWDNVLANNIISDLGSFDNSFTNYGSGKRIGNQLLLPVSGSRNIGSNGLLFGRGCYGFFWSTTEYSTSKAWLLYLGKNFAITGHSDRAYGLSVRCVSDDDEISALLCENVVVSDSLTAGRISNGTSFYVPYVGGKGGSFDGQVIYSSGVTGLSAHLNTGVFENGSGSLEYIISGTPAHAGTASFAISIGGQSCTLNIPVSLPVCRAKISSTEYRNFMCHNLGAANTDADPFTPSWEINGGYWQWGRKEQAAAGPSGPGVAEANDGAVSGWNTTGASSGSWSNTIKMANDPCPAGYRIPTGAQWDSVISNNVFANVGAWADSPTNFSSGKKIGAQMFLPAPGYRGKNYGELNLRGNYGYYWSSSELDAEYVWNLGFSSSNESISVYYGYRINGGSVRCVAEDLASIGSIYCDSVIVSGSLVSGNIVSGVSVAVPYTGGNGGMYNGQTIISTGVTGLTATLNTGTLLSGSSSLIYIITGTPTSSGTASFAISIGGQTCTLNIPVSLPVCRAKISPTEYRNFMCHNLGAANTDADPFTPSWEINGGYWQWGRKEQAAAGPSGPGGAEANDGAINGWSTSIISDNLWSDSIKTSKDPCPLGYRIPSRSFWDSILTNNNQYVVGTWSNSALNYSSGRFLGSQLMLPASGYRDSQEGNLINRGYYGSYWSSTSHESNNAWHLEFISSNSNTHADDYRYAVSVRCVESEIPSVGSISSLDCSNKVISEPIILGKTAYGVSVNIPYSGGNGGPFVDQTISSTEVTGLVARLYAGLFSPETGQLTLYISGTALRAGKAKFEINVGGQSCTLEIPVILPVCRAKISQTEYRNFMCHNLGAANTDANPFVASWEINGGYWQWGRKEQSAAGPLGPDISESNSGVVSGWDNNLSPTCGWSDSYKTANDPCPDGYRVPTRSQLEGLIQHNATTNFGTWDPGVFNYSSGKKFGADLFLPASGNRAYSGGWLNYHDYTGNYWSSTERDTANVWSLSFGSADLFMYPHYRVNGFSIRCIAEDITETGSIGALHCDSVYVNGVIRVGQAVSGASVVVPYSGGSCILYDSMSISSTGVTGLTASLAAGSTSFDKGVLIFQIRGTASRAGTASFALNIGGRSCTIHVPVNLPVCRAKVSTTEYRNFMCHNLGVASNAADPFVPGWEINGGYWQWGRKGQVAAGPNGPEASEANNGAVAGWNVTPAVIDSWTDDQNKPINDPCPSGYRVPTSTQWESVIANNNLTIVGTWESSLSNYSSGKRFGSELLLPAAGHRNNIDGILVNRGSVGLYWSSSLVSNNYSWNLIFDANSANIDYDGSYTSNRTFGYSVRCIEFSGSIGALNCASVEVSNGLVAYYPASGVTATVPYESGNGGKYASQSISSTGVTGLTAHLTGGSFAIGSGSISFTLSGKPLGAGNASFLLNIGGQTCTIEIPVSVPVCRAKISPTAYRNFMCYNLGSANMTADPFTPGWEINGGYWQWGRKEQSAAGPSGPDISESNSGVVNGWDYNLSPSCGWSDSYKTANDPCPDGYRVPTRSQMEGLIQHNATTNFGTWDPGVFNYSSGKKFGADLFLPASGNRAYSGGWLNYHDYTGNYWSSTERDTANVWSLSFGSADLFMYPHYRVNGFSIRCIAEGSTETGSIGALYCDSVYVNGVIRVGQAVSGASIVVPYSGGSCILYDSLSISSTGVTGLTASLAAGSTSFDKGVLIFQISGTASRAGTASFALNIGGRSCTIHVPVNLPVCRAKISPTVYRNFMCHNLGVASTDADPFVPGWEINGGYWQWGQMEQAAAGPDTLDGRSGAVAGWNFNPVSNGMWSDISKTVNDPCPAGYRIPSKEQWDSVVVHNTVSQLGTWSNGFTNYSAGKKIGNELFLPASGLRSSTDGALSERGYSGSYASCTENSTDSTGCWFYHFYENSSQVTDAGQRTNGFSVRCIEFSGSIGVLNCASVEVSNGLVAYYPVSGVTATVPYESGNGGKYDSQSISSTGVTGLTAHLTGGSFAIGSGSISFTLSGKPLGAGNASFLLNIGGQTCTIEIPVSVPVCRAKISPTAYRNFMCYNLGSANMTADPFTPGWEINGGYWQWGRKEQSAAGPSGPDISESNSGVVSGWSNYLSTSCGWSDSYKTANDPCPDGYRVPTRRQLEGLIQYNPTTNYGTWDPGIFNYSSGKKFGENLFLPASGARAYNDGILFYHDYTGNYWTSTERDTTNVWSVSFGNADLFMYAHYRGNGFSVRCIAEDSTETGSIGALYCDSVYVSGVVRVGQAVSGASVVVPYSGGSCILYDSQSISSTGVTGLTASLAAGSTSFAEGVLIFQISGTATRAGTASFALNIGGRSCTIHVPVNLPVCRAKISPTVYRNFMCHNLGVASTDADPFIPSWEINGGYWQWGRKEQAAAGPSGPGVSAANDVAVTGWNTTGSPDGAWSDTVKTVNDPCPSGFRIPTRAQWIAVADNNTLEYLGSWFEDSTNFSSGKKFGTHLLLPASGLRYNFDGILYFRGTSGYYWSSTENGPNSAWHLYFDTSYTLVYYYGRPYGSSVRCIEE